MKTNPLARAPAPAPGKSSTSARYGLLREAVLDSTKPPPARVFRKPDGTVAGMMQVRRTQRLEDI